MSFGHSSQSVSLYRNLSQQPHYLHCSEFFSQVLNNSVHSLETTVLPVEVPTENSVAQTNSELQFENTDETSEPSTSKPDSCELQTPTKNLTQSKAFDHILKKLSSLPMTAPKKLSTRKWRTQRSEILTSSPNKHSLVQKLKNTKPEQLVLCLTIMTLQNTKYCHTIPPYRRPTETII